MRKLIIIALLFSLITIPTFSQQKSASDIVSLEIIDKNNSVKTVEFEWPYPPGPPPVGGAGSVVEKVNKICKENGIECPPVRQKVSDNVWLCSNGKKIRTKSVKLAKLLSKAWD